MTAPSPPSRQWPFKIEFSQSDISNRNYLYYELPCLVKDFLSSYAAHARVAPNSGQLMQGIQLAQQTNKCNNKKQGHWNITDRFDIRRKKKPGNTYYALKAFLCGLMHAKGFAPRPLPYFFLAGLMNLRIFFFRLLDFWVHYHTLPYPKLKNHYPSGPAGQWPFLFHFDPYYWWRPTSS